MGGTFLDRVPPAPRGPRCTKWSHLDKVDPIQIGTTLNTIGFSIPWAKHEEKHS